ncbi:MAG: hypothetical protein INR62_06525 [Rhodospirillales bacterium]|nr:hypothetical protein [Acetobacter sp.]
MPPLVSVQRFDVDGVDLPMGDGAVVLSPGHNRFTFGFAALSYTLPAKIRYRYKLDGFDRDWVEAGVAHTAVYTSLPPGHYRFFVQAQNNDGVWNRSDAVLPFRIRLPVYRRWWFALLVLLGLAGIVFLLFQLRERIVQRRFTLVLQERNRIAREVHDTLAQDFVSVSLQLDIASTFLRTQQVELAAEQLQDTRRLVKEGLQAARQSIWNLRATAGEDSLPTRLSALVGRSSFAGRPPRLTMGGAFRKLPAAVEGEALRIAQEALSNASRHANATDVEVTLFYSPDDLQLTVRDNGQGFLLEEAASKAGHYGLRGMRERSETLGGELMIASSPENGTTISLRVPLGKEMQRT